jgi:hypothetical protein
MAQRKGSVIRNYINTGSVAVPVMSVWDCETSFELSQANDLLETTGKCNPMTELLRFQLLSREPGHLNT